MTREFSTKPRFEDNGDIEPCDTESRMINRPDDFGVRESSSSGRAGDSTSTAAISVPLLQSPTTTQGPGDDAADEDFVMPPHPAMISAGNLAKTGLNAETNAGIALGEDLMQSGSVQCKAVSSISPMLKDRRSALLYRTPHDCLNSAPPTTITTATSQISHTTFASVTIVGNTAVQQSAAATAAAATTAIEKKNAFEKRIINNQDCESTVGFGLSGGENEAAVLVEIKSAVNCHVGNDCHVTTTTTNDDEDNSDQVGVLDNKKANYLKNGIRQIEADQSVESAEGGQPGVQINDKPGAGLAVAVETSQGVPTAGKQNNSEEEAKLALLAKGQNSSSSSLLVSVINSSAIDYSQQFFSQTSDDSLKQKMNLKNLNKTISDDDNDNDFSSSLRTMIPTIKPSDYYFTDNNNKQFILQTPRAQSPSIDDKNTDDDDQHVVAVPKTQFSEVDATPVAAGDAALSKLQEQPNTFVVKDPSPKNNAISSINRSSTGCGPCDSGAPKPSQVATKNDIPNNNCELVSFKDDDAQKAHSQGHRFVPKNNKAIQPCSLSPFVSCASQLSSYSRRTGWNVPLIGLKGGAGGETSVANGTSGWGPPPTGAASASGWGAPPPPNPSASAAWGAPPVGLGSKSPQQEDGSNNVPNAKAPLSVAGPPPAGLAPAPIVSQQPVNVASATQPPTAAPISGPPTVQPLQTSTSWAAAAGKGLPTTTNDQTNTTSSSVTASNGSTSKHLEQLNSVREALFSQDGWGGSNVKQDSAWNVDGITPSSNASANAASASSASTGGAASSAGASAAASASTPVEPKESNTWGAGGAGHKNDGTDLWRVTLSGQPPAVTKPQPNNAWNHTPQNNTDFKQWGVNDDDDHQGQQGGQGANGAIGQRSGHHGQGQPEPSASMWGGAGNEASNGPNQFKPRGHNDWNNPGGSSAGAGGGSWGDNRNDPMGRGAGGNGGMNMNDPNAGGNGGGWGPSPAKPNPGQWGGNSNPAAGGSRGGGANSSWDLESPSMQRRGGGGGGGDNDGTSHWGFKPPQPSAAPGPAGVSHWKDMPSSNSQMRGPPGGPGAQPRLGGPVKDSIWPRGPNAWGDMSENSQMGGNTGSGGGGWGDLDGGKRESSVWPDPGPTGGSTGGWGAGNRGRNPVGPSNGGMHRSSPGWGNQDDTSLDGGWPNSSMKAVGGGPKKPTDMMWQQSKQYSMLLDMGYRKEDVEQALHTVNGNLEDALEILGSSRGMPPSRGRGGPDPMGFGGGVGRNDNNMYGNESRRFPGPGQGMGPPYGGPQDPSLVNNPGLQGSFGGSGPGNPMMQKMGMPGSAAGGVGSSGMNPNSNSALPTPGSLGAMPPISNTRPQQQQQQQPSSQPSAQQLRMLVQQIQMAVQAGHLNPQILNQPLAPQTLILLNQLLQQIKTLQTLQQSHSVAQSQKPMNNSRELLSISVNITKTKQHITNLQNQISAQQATYLKSQNMGGQGGNSSSSGAPGTMPPGHLGGGSSNEPSMPDLFNELSLSSGNSGMNDNVGGSRLSQWKLTPGDSLFGGNNSGKAGGKNASSPGLGFGGDDTWGLPSNSTNSGWPEKSGGGSGNGAPGGQGGPSVSSAPGAPGNNNASNTGGSNNTNNDALNGIDAFGIPEFEPGKPWKGPGLKNPDEDPTLTPGSVAPSAIDLMSSKTNTSSSNTLVENTLGLTSPTWSFNNPTSSEKPKDSWSITNPTSTLTAMGQDLWGKSGRSNPPGLSNSGSSWPTTTSSGSSNGWSSGQNGSASNSNNFDQPTWLLLKNLTPQIDGSTLKTLCIQHGPLKNFHLFLNNGIALVMYASGREATKAQKALNNCLLGNTTIQANMTTENEASQIMQQLGGGGNSNSQNQASRGATPSSVANTLIPKSTSAGDMWGNSMVSTSIYSGSSIWGAPTSDEGTRNTPQLQPYLPGDLLGESNM